MTAARLRKLAGLALWQLQRAASATDLAARRARLALSGRSDLDREAEHWSGHNGDLLTWQDHPLVRAHINRRVSGDPAINWIDALARDFGPFDHGLNLGCGVGDLEAHALAVGLCRSFLSVDISQPALDRARARLPGAVEFLHADVNTLDVEPGAFDVAFAASSLHHFTALPRVLDAVRHALRPGGLFVFDEFVGPSLFQWRDRQLEIVNDILAALPRRLLRDRRRPLFYKTRVYRRPLDDSSRDSPFEAARSEEILPLVAERFEIVRCLDYGGAILHPLLDGVAGNFRPGDPGDDALLRRLIETEERLEARGEIASDFCSVVARRPA